MTRRVEQRANELLREGNTGVRRMPFAAAIKAASTMIATVAVFVFRRAIDRIARRTPPRNVSVMKAD